MARAHHDRRTPGDWLRGLFPTAAARVLQPPCRIPERQPDGDRAFLHSVVF